MFQKIGAWEEETVGRSGGLSLRPLMLVAQGPPFTTTTSTEAGGQAGVGAVRLVYRARRSSLEHLHDRESLVKQLGAYGRKLTAGQQGKTSSLIEKYVARLVTCWTTFCSKVRSRVELYPADTSSSMKLGRSSMGSTSSRGSEEPGRRRKDSTEERDVETRNIIDRVAKGIL